MFRFESFRNSGKTIQLNRVVINDGREQWDIGYYRNGERLGGMVMSDQEFEVLKDELSRFISSPTSGSVEL